jgi:hypothetical protein
MIKCDPVTECDTMSQYGDINVMVNWCTRQKVGNVWQNFVILLMWIVEEILDSKMMNRKLCYLVKWKDFGMEHNSWEPWDNVHAPELIVEFYRKHPGAARYIWTAEFSAILFRPTTVPGRHFLKGG